jgi:hypothetical protein
VDLGELLPARVIFEILVEHVGRHLLWPGPVDLE